MIRARIVDAVSNASAFHANRAEIEREKKLILVQIKSCERRGKDSGMMGDGTDIFNSSYLQFLRPNVSVSFKRDPHQAQLMFISEKIGTIIYLHLEYW